MFLAIKFLAKAAFCMATIFGVATIFVIFYTYYCMIHAKIHRRLRDLGNKVIFIEGRLKKQVFSDAFWNNVGKETGLKINAETIQAARDEFTKTLATPVKVADVGTKSLQLPSNQYDQVSACDPNYRTMAQVVDCFSSGKLESSTSKLSNEPEKGDKKPEKPRTPKDKTQEEPKSSEQKSNGVDPAGPVGDYETIDIVDKVITPPPA
ncbi:hypothetical protein L596_030389 [Steinernema carpocapsae]|uniref:Uncharacterized protein n=1 Tax=Steinernema carpocapsae TaxID=34508 RepID=A0A4V5ZWX8_STECR|nr:hypothetical protein L596_030389 [Steinernema carpocapsae]